MITCFFAARLVVVGLFGLTGWSERIRLGTKTSRLSGGLSGFFGGSGRRAGTENAASTGSTCHSGRHELSPAWKAMSVPEPVLLGAVRFSLGRGTTPEELDHVVSMLRSRFVRHNT